jgi:hypothetical protein
VTQFAALDDETATWGVEDGAGGVAHGTLGTDRRRDMSKPTITRLFVGSLIAIVGGLVLFVAAGILAIASSSLVMNGPDVTGIQPTTFAWSMVAVAAVAMMSRS